MSDKKIVHDEYRAVSARYSRCSNLIEVTAVGACIDGAPLLWTIYFRRADESCPSKWKYELALTHAPCSCTKRYPPTFGGAWEDAPSWAIEAARECAAKARGEGEIFCLIFKD